MTPSTPRTLYIPLPPHTPSPNLRLLDSAHSSLHTLVFHPLLRYSQHSMPSLVWDVRTDPILASLLQEAPVSTNDGTMSAHAPVLVPAHELHQPATTPPLRVLHLLCGIAPHTSTWSTIDITAQNSITVLDVLDAVRECMRTPITGAEWDALCVKQQNRVNETFDSRWRMSRTPLATRGNGVLRQDCLLLHTLWGGLMPSFVEDDVAVLALRRQ
ncbi:hypothetical protein C0993_003122 [Termitomyces sp. T159_Od127]|nr:hypothetical protein C0993_003122 [Termitomyces sp. T159_Od127]